MFLKDGVAGAVFVKVAQPWIIDAGAIEHWHGHKTLAVATGGVYWTLVQHRLRVQVSALPGGKVAIQFRHVLEYGDSGQ